MFNNLKLKTKSLKLKAVSGFTLVEMLIVIAIIAVLASIALVSVGGIRKSVNDKKRIADLQKIQGYLELYYNQNRHYPPTTAATNITSDPASIGLTGIVNALPIDVIATSPYVYARDTGGQHYVLKAVLETDDSILRDPNELDGTQHGGVDCGAVSGDTSFYYCVGM